MAAGGNRGRVGAGEVLEARKLLAAALTGTRAAEVRAFAAPTSLPKAPSIFVEPQDGRGVILQAIAAARRQIRLGICNLSDPVVGQALADAAARGVDVRVLVDRNDYEANPGERELLATLAAQGVAVHLSNPVFHQSFEKTMLVDRRQVFIMTMCLVPATFEDTRDFGLVLARPDVIREVGAVFDNDWSYSASPGEATPPYNPTPPLHVADLLWSPVNSRAKLLQLIQKARHTIDATTELLDDPFLESALIAAARRRVHVRMILPLEPREAASNRAGIALLADQGVDVRVTTRRFPTPAEPPYMHAKTMVVDGHLAYLGSIDLQSSSTSDDRELGILFRQPALVSRLRSQFLADWSTAEAPPAGG